MSPRTHVRLGAATIASISVALVLLTGGCVDAPHKNFRNTGPAAPSVSTGPPESAVSTEPPRSLVNTGPPGSSMSTRHTDTPMGSVSPETQANIDASHRSGGDKVPHHAEPPVVASGPPSLKGPLPETPNFVPRNPSTGSGSQPPNMAPQQNAPTHKPKHPKGKTR